MKRLAALSMIAWLAAPAMAAPSIAGVPWIIDGDTLDIHGTRIRLFGIDAPEREQVCDRAGRAWRCGESAKRALIRFIGQRAVTCAPRGRDHYGRTVAVCSIGGADINRWMVAQGRAVAYRHYSDAYDGAEDQARAAHRGIWAGTFEQPWRWRRAHPH